MLGSLSSLCAIVVGYAQKTGMEDDSRTPILKASMLMMPFWAPAIGGMVIVGLELQEYGICRRIHSTEEAIIL